MPTPQMQALFMKYRQRQQRAQAHLTRGPQELAAIVTRARAKLSELVARLAHATAEYRQAEANVRGA
jgi:phage shock protein A